MKRDKRAERISCNDDTRCDEECMRCVNERRTDHTRAVMQITLDAHSPMGSIVLTHLLPGGIDDTLEKNPPE